MKLSPTSQRLFRVALLGTMATPLVLVLVSLVRQPASFAKPRILLWLGAYALFSIVFWLTARQDEKLSRVRLMASLIVEMLLVLLMVNSICNGYEGALLVVVAGQLATPLDLGRLNTRPHILGESQRHLDHPIRAARVVKKGRPYTKI